MAFIGKTNAPGYIPQWDGTKWIAISTGSIGGTNTTTIISASNNDVYPSSGSKGWVTLFDVDCTTQTSASFVTSSSFIPLFGYNWFGQNLTGNVDSFGILPGVGLVLDPNGSNTDQFTSTFTAPTLFLPITRALADFNINEHELRVWSILELTGSNANYEVTRIGFAKYTEGVGGNPQNYYISWIKGFDAVNMAQTDNFYNGSVTRNAFDNTHNLFCVHLKDHRSADFYSGLVDTKDPIPDLSDPRVQHKCSFPNIGNTNATMVTSSKGYSLMITAYPVGAGNSFQATYRRIKLEYRRKDVVRNPTVPIYTLQALAGIASTNTAASGSKSSIGMFYFDPTVINNFTGSNSKQYKWRTILNSSETVVSAAVDLFDYTGIVTGATGTIAGSQLSTSSLNSVHLEVDLSSVLSTVTGSGIFEARLWRYQTPVDMLTTTSSVFCRNARLDVIMT